MYLSMSYGGKTMRKEKRVCVICGEVFYYAKHRPREICPATMCRIEQRKRSIDKRLEYNRRWRAKKNAKMQETLN